MKDLLQLSTAKLQRIIKVKKQIERLEARLGKLAGGKGAAIGLDAPRKRRKMSAAGRKAISDAAKARWARERAAKK
jgi:hypothetical protein